jgi:hypothetical protein
MGSHYHQSAQVAQTTGIGKLNDYFTECFELVQDMA